MGFVMIELKDCPFCGGKADIFTQHIDHRTYFRIECVSCGCQTKMNGAEHLDLSDGLLKEDGLCCLNWIIKAWNRRTEETKNGQN